MTRSVEIPEEAVEAAYEALTDEDIAPEERTRAAIEAALPYLAPAGDGGLREALEKLADDADHYDTCSSLLNPDAGYECSCLLADIRALLAAHPAAPAVPQPVDREALAIQIRKHTLFPADEVETRETCACGWRPTGNPMLAYSEHARHVADELAVLAALNPAVPQPVDREALAKALHESDWRFNHGWKESGRCGEAHREQFYVQADALFDAGLLVGPCCAASAGDGGLREALEKLADDAVPLNGVEWVSAARLRDLLAAHSAAPAVPHGPYTEQETTN